MCRGAAGAAWPSGTLNDVTLDEAIHRQSPFLFPLHSAYRRDETRLHCA